MGTRNLTVVYLDGEYRIAQYGQWDGNPSGQGITILNFLLSLKGNYEPFKAQVRKVRFVEDKEVKDFLKTIGSDNGFMTYSQASQFHERYPLLNRDIGGEILEKVRASREDTIVVQNSMVFAADSLFCEWAYVIDFDKGTFEVYHGFNKRKLGKTQRFANLDYHLSYTERYYPVRLCKSFSLGSLPTEDEFLSNFEKD